MSNLQPESLNAGGLPSSPWVLVDDNTVGQTAQVLEQLTAWLLTAEPGHTGSFADAISRGDTDAEGVAYWIDALAARLRHCTQAAEL